MTAAAVAVSPPRVGRTAPLDSVACRGCQVGGEVGLSACAVRFLDQGESGGQGRVDIESVDGGDHQLLVDDAAPSP